MSVRTSAVVAVGLGLLTVVGVGTVFGESIVAVFAPPPAEMPLAGAPKPAAGPAPAGAAAPAPTPAAVGGDGGTPVGRDGSS